MCHFLLPLVRVIVERIFFLDIKQRDILTCIPISGSICSLGEHFEVLSAFFFVANREKMVLKVLQCYLS